jgi:acyl-lipid omega-6 desaturase (Delta-12 desaturase)
MDLSPKERLERLKKHVKPNTLKGVVLFATDAAVLIAALAGVLWLPGWPLKALASLLAGFKIGSLIALGHEAAHNALTRSRRLNWWIAVLSFAPALFNYRLWLYDHHHLHHQRPNRPKENSFGPLTLEAYRALPAWRRAIERFWRSGWLPAFGLYYVVRRWLAVDLIPGSWLPERLRPSAWRHFAALAAWAAAWLSFLAFCAPQIAPVSALAAVALGFFVPLFVAQTIFGLFLYLQHTHPSIPWVGHEADNVAGEETIGQEELTLHLRLPALLSFLVHHSMEHPVHHLMPKIPCYELRAAQAELNEMLGATARQETLSVAALRRIWRVCKLYDHERRQWVGFDGAPLSEPHGRAPRDVGPRRPEAVAAAAASAAQPAEAPKTGDADPF